MGISKNNTFSAIRETKFHIEKGAKTCDRLQNHAFWERRVPISKKVLKRATVFKIMLSERSMTPTSILTKTF
jgi:hypothetical protein